MKTADFDFDLPPECIAQSPVSPRDASRLMVLDRAGEGAVDAVFRDVPHWLRRGDLLVLNDTRVFPARLRAAKAETGGQVEVFLLECVGAGVWEVLLRASRRPRPGSFLALPGGCRCELLEDLGEGRARVRVEDSVDLVAVAEQWGETPLPPYISRGAQAQTDLEADRSRYQTVYARETGAVAAPTAGLHFTDGLFERLAAAGVETANVTLHVGLGTFRPVSASKVADHRMEAERFTVPPETVEAVRATRARGGRVVAVGSTSVRTLETVADGQGGIRAEQGRSDLFIVPGHRFQVVDGMITNFHLPCSTLIMMVSAFAGRSRVLAAYRAAVERGYRFYSYGDAMLLL